ncbi:MAG: hypothetical protein A2788_01180 [Candidatus Abawacabacteria bacterium RIFCSPHIGHO2_01_FULL_46_8]|uniref:Uncharacterized protein n=1 Tax=Candidatus Abawacabacteria bacterium RIFCSPHIGHO2_01_FULL_46_8 TaxID=1817815 RepID=A0A1F4XNB3_9BACT|nr:MAG: hypothetical protein A2788_01180 [Candidatus Abawacabacteria bacterium RIFCSPHIGHO2_01_FULL_46_8]
MSEKFESQENKPERATREDVESLLSDLEQYDRDHSLGVWLGRGMAGSVMMGLFEKSEDEEERDELQEEISKNLKLQDVLNKHQNTLEKLGIDLESPNPHGDYDEHETYAVGDMKIDFTNQENFVDYLKSLDEKSLSAGEMRLVKMVLNKVLNRVRQEYSFESADERLLELFSGIKNMVMEAKRLGLEKEANELERCIHYNNQKSLPAYIHARNRGFVEPIGEGYNWSTWQRDCSPERYIELWEDVFDVLANAKVSKKSAQLYNDILAYATASIEFAENDPTEYVVKNKGLHAAIEKTKKKLGKFKQIELPK